MNLFEALAACGAHLSKFGGHAGAAGMSLTIDRWRASGSLLRRGGAAAERPRRVSRRGRRRGGLGDLDLPFTEELARLAPFGAANREPLFALRGVTTRATGVVGKGHLQLTLDHDGTIGEAIAFGFGGDDPGPGALLDLVATAELDPSAGPAGRG